MRKTILLIGVIEQQPGKFSFLRGEYFSISFDGIIQFSLHRGVNFVFFSIEYPNSSVAFCCQTNV
jgi:hypothetical protein